MLGTHNSLTSYPAKNKIVELFSPLWRCQTASFNEQLMFGVDYFDIRLRFDKNGEIVFCHGFADLHVIRSLRSILLSLANNGCKCRIIIERGENKGIFQLLDKAYPRWADVVDSVVVKKGWKALYNRSKHKIKDYSFVPFLSNKSFWYNLTHMKFSTIYQWADKHNPKTDYCQLKDDDVVHFMDYWHLHDNRIPWFR